MWSRFFFGACLCVLLRVPMGAYAADDPQQLAQAAKIAQQSGDFQSATRDYLELIRLYPSTGELYSNLGIIYYQSRQLPLAVKALEKALALSPKLISALIFKGIAEYDLGRTKDAVIDLQQACEAAPADPLAQIWLAYSLAALSEYRDAVTHFQLATELSPNDVDAWYGLGEAHLRWGEQQIRKLAEIAPDGARIWQLAGEQQKLLGNEKQAEPLLAEANKRRPDLDHFDQTAEDTTYRSIESQQTLAKQAFENLLALSPDSYRSHQVWAETFALQGDYDRAISEYRAVLSRKPELHGVHLQLGDLLARTGRQQEALQEYDAEIKTSGPAAIPYLREGMVLEQMGQDDRALASFVEANKLGASPIDSDKQLAKIYMHRKQYGRAAAILSDYEAKQSGDAQVHYLLMQCYEKLNNHTAALREQALFKDTSEDEKHRRPELILDRLTGFEPKAP